jgi:elongation of very long chain fatty acids protein 6
MDFLIATNYLVREDTIHLTSPLLYMMFVYIIKNFPHIPDNRIMIFFRKLHNINLSVLSLFMFVGLTIGQLQTGKFESLDALLCKSYVDNQFAYYSARAFLWSKYLEWGDTLFLQLGGKPISMLQYTHHMSTAILTYYGVNHDIVSPMIYIQMSMNCVIHVFMYWYFAYPKGGLYRYRKLITSSQIIQHIISLTSLVYVKMNEPNCKQNPWFLEIAIGLYFMYLFYFTAFYLKSYKSGNNKIE